MKSITVFGSHGQRSTPYIMDMEGRVLIKRVEERHIYRARWSVGIDAAIWQQHKDSVDIVRFKFEDGSVRELTAREFERKSFTHGNGISFAITKFVRINDLEIVCEKRQNPHQLALFATAGV